MGTEHHKTRWNMVVQGEVKSMKGKDGGRLFLFITQRSRVQIPPFYATFLYVQPLLITFAFSCYDLVNVL